ncbi:MarR family winged helix-turn-helix transcriptional regulator [Kineococcus rubinsiae]|uniref:MarR family winged helix-turn-helix transcriptional regulator n=1 Tax=Kineococcus rubinsiae TaxID=2609562 RepID=UPI0014321365|nr:MarR family transcriptional regulator [Kineococcus rubinsiae]NIZ91679.1 MarR family transcriptional regulator [Kineococcus rubinsiae]
MTTATDAPRDTDPADPAACLPPGSRLAGGPVAGLAVQLTRQIRALHGVKAVMARDETDAERAMHTVLLVLSDTGPQRVTALAERLATDPSTTSRQAAELVKRGLLQRLPDPDDRRAGLLAVTSEGLDVAHAMRERRHDLLAHALHDWSDSDVEALGDYLGRLADSLERTRTELTTGTRPATPGRPAATDHVEETA